MPTHTSSSDWEFSIPHVGVSINSVNFKLATPNSKSRFIAKRIDKRFGRMFNWIDEYVEKKSTFVDVGSNFGIASIYAAKSRSCQVLSFEPHYGSYYIQYRNVIGNRLQEKIFPFQIALSSGDIIGNNFKITDASSGRALNTHIFSNSTDSSSSKIAEEIESLKSVRYANENKQRLAKNEIMQTNVCMTFDHFYQLMNCTGFDKTLPMHMKIDVDGLDFLVLTGAINNLANIQSIFIEYLPNEITLSSLIPNLLEQFDFKITDQDSDNLILARVS